MYKSQVAQQKPDMTMLKMYGYTDEQIAAEVEKSEGKVSELYYSAIHAAEEQILQAQTQIEAIDAQLGAVETGQSDYLVTANESGRIHIRSTAFVAFFNLPSKLPVFQSIIQIGLNNPIASPPEDSL
jgi:hypothetical protein